MFASCCACVHKKPKKILSDETVSKEEEEQEENAEETPSSLPSPFVSPDDDASNDAIEIVEKSEITTDIPEVVVKVSDKEPEAEDVTCIYSSHTAETPTKDVQQIDTVAVTEYVEEKTEEVVKHHQEDDDAISQASGAKDGDDIPIQHVYGDESVGGEEVTDSANMDDGNETSEQIDQSLSDTSNDTTIISRNSPQNVPDDNNQILPKNDDNDNGGSTSSPSDDILNNDGNGPKSCLSRRCSSRSSSIKKKVNYSESQEIIPPPPLDPVYAVLDDEDEVFSDSISPKVPRGDMCTPYPKKKGSIPGMVLPDWFLDDREVGGILEPPVTPIGRDELALKRHRFFTDLLTAAQAAAEHRVRFDPLGPNVSVESNDCDPNIKPSTTFELENLINRLEKIVERLERAVSARELERVNATLSSVIQKTDSEELDSIPLPLLPTSSGYQSHHYDQELEPESAIASADLEQQILSPPIPFNPTISVESAQAADDQLHDTIIDDFLNLNGDKDSVDLDSLPTVISQLIYSETEQIQIVPIADSQPSYPPISMSVTGYEDLISGPLAQYLALSKTIAGDVEKLAEIVRRAFAAQLQYVKLASTSAQPNPTKQQELLKPTSDCIMEIQGFSEKNRSSEYRNHLLAISESIPALGWVCIAPTPGPHVKEMICSAEYYTNRILKDYKEKNKTHVDWAKTWIQLLTDLRQFIMQHHTTGLVWSGKTDLNSVSAPPPPPPGIPPPPPALPPLGDLSLNPIDGNDDRSALFAQINQGEDITKSLKRVTPDMQTHKNSQLRTGPAPFKAPTSSTVLSSSSVKAPVAIKEPVFNRDGKKWIIEYHKSNPNLLVENAEMNNVVYIFKCESSTLTVKGKINSIVMDSCKKCSILFDSVVSSVEFVNCQSVQMQVLGNVPTISIDKTDGCQMYLSKDSFHVEIISSKSSEMNVLIPKGNGEYVEKPIPEQFKTTINGEALHTICVESLG